MFQLQKDEERNGYNRSGDDSYLIANDNKKNRDEQHNLQ